MADWWPKACRTQGWDDQDRTLRLEVLSEAVERALTTANDLDKKRDIDAVKAYLGWLAEDVGRTRELYDPEPGERRRILWLIRRHARALGGDRYVLALARDKFGVTAGLSTIEDLATAQLWQLMITLNARRRSQAAHEASLASEEAFADEVEFVPQPDEALVEGPF